MPHPSGMPREPVPADKVTELPARVPGALMLGPGRGCLHTCHTSTPPHPLLGCPGHRPLVLFCPHLHFGHFSLLSLRLSDVTSYSKTLLGSVFQRTPFWEFLWELPGGPVVRGLHALTAEGPGSIPDWGTEIPQATRHSRKKKKEPPSFPRPTEERAGVFSSGWRAAEDEI